MKQKIKAELLVIAIFILAVVAYAEVPGETLKFFVANASGMLIMAIKLYETN